jgi:drug/metabolite transporter (DMT)-like permease
MATELYAIGLVIVASFMGAFGAIYLKKGSKHFVFNIKKLIANWELILGLSLYVVPTALFIIALRAGELSVLYPFVATIYVWISILSVKFLGEKMNLWKWAGIAAIILGVSLIGFGS